MTTDIPNEKHELVLLTESPYDTPDPSKALEDPEGLSAVGGDLSTARLLHLYSKGFFPWFSDPDPILWWHPAERCTLVPNTFHASKSLKKALKKTQWTYSVNQAFSQVIEQCASLRADKEGTWISTDIQSAYTELHKMGFAHSIEIWHQEHLIGGFYGIAMGKMFFGESMFSLQANASKAALRVFCSLADQCEIQLIDCQVESDHLMSLGAKCLPRSVFCEQLAQFIPRVEKNMKLLEMGKNGTKYPL
ncbi:leucyl/phenylalanyl-tRNA--protein transferase [Marinomonas algarum]|uniref:Leucyl/phenylalanyl-tRNA--protein transferase n=1 Tax=Marinomonas algarum TaxID=2883105 RepID=A0A9X1IN49_9GAMM|nr:leucyl/phenylalanyl-tRNA--protein transferase [Marinomonas algarum]MCB5160808.1 leucyl/phenylalanyl-tRNA--protein transferase [Marinomonas algarum]